MSEGTWCAALGRTLMAWVAHRLDPSVWVRGPEMESGGAV